MNRGGEHHRRGLGRAGQVLQVRRAIEASASSSSRAVAIRSAVHAGMRRLTKASSRRLISSAQCRSSSTSTRGWRAATCSMSSATLSNRGSALSLAGGRPAMPASGSSRVSSARRGGVQGAEDLLVGADPAAAAGVDPRAEGEDRVALVAAADHDPASSGERVGRQRADEPRLADARFAHHRGDVPVSPDGLVEQLSQPPEFRLAARTAASPPRGDRVAPPRPCRAGRERWPPRASGASPPRPGAEAVPDRAASSPPRARSPAPAAAPPRTPGIA